HLVVGIPVDGHPLDLLDQVIPVEIRVLPASEVDQPGRLARNAAILVDRDESVDVERVADREAGWTHVRLTERTGTRRIIEDPNVVRLPLEQVDEHDDIAIPLELVEVAAHRLALGLREVARIGELPALVQFDLLDEAPANRGVFYDHSTGELERVSRSNRPRPNDDLGGPLIRPIAPHEAAAAGGALRLLPGTEGPNLYIRLDNAARDLGVLRE